MHCRDFALGPGRQIKNDYVDDGRVRFVYRHLAFLGQESVWAAEAAECAGDQGKFWEYHDMLYEHWVNVPPDSSQFAYDNLVGFADILELDSQQFAACLNDRKYVDRVRTESEYADDNGITSTPWVLINGERVRGVEYGIFRDAIEAALAAAQ